MATETRLIRSLAAVLIIAGIATTPSRASHSHRCDIKLFGASKATARPGETLDLYGIWSAPQGQKVPVIMSRDPYRLTVIAWHDTLVKARLPDNLPPGRYRIGVYCGDPQQVDLPLHSGFTDLIVVAGREGNATRAGLWNQSTSSRTGHGFEMTVQKTVRSQRLSFANYVLLFGIFLFSLGIYGIHHKHRARQRDN